MLYNGKFAFLQKEYPLIPVRVSDWQTHCEELYNQLFRFKTSEFLWGLRPGSTFLSKKWSVQGNIASL